MHFVPVLELMSDSLTTISVESHICTSHQFNLLTQGPIALNLVKRYWELMVLKNVVFLSRPFWSSQRFLGSKDGTKFWWLSWFPAHEVLGQHLCTGLYVCYSPLNGSMTVVADAQKVITRTPFPKPSTEEFLGCRPAQFYSSQKHFPRTTGNLDLYQICIRRFWAFKKVFPWWESWMLNLIGVNNSFY